MYIYNIDILITYTYNHTYLIANDHSFSKDLQAESAAAERRQSGAGAAPGGERHLRRAGALRLRCHGGGDVAMGPVKGAPWISWEKRGFHPDKNEDCWSES